MTDIETIAEAISPDRTGWAWKEEDQILQFAQVPNIGPHNILRVIEWATRNLKTWREVYKGSHGGLCASPRSAISNIFESLLTGTSTTEIVVRSSIRIIAEATRRETP